jgi:hypothetical protein
MAREAETRKEIREAGADAGSLPAQNNAADGAEQQLPATHNGWRERTAALAPWIIQLFWLAAGVATVGYLKSRDWAMFEAIPLVMGAAFGLTAWLEWTIAWAFLTRWSMYLRFVYLLAGAIGILVIADWIFEWRRDDIGVPLLLGIISIGNAVPLALVYWRGCRIDVRGADGHQHLRTNYRLGQFSLSELILLTTGVAIFLGLILVQRNVYGQYQWGEVVSECVIVACGSMLVVVGLAARRFVLAISICLLISLALIIAALAWFDVGIFFRPSEWLLVGLICCPAFVGIVASIGLARWWGYRLTRHTPSGGGG